MPSDADLLGTLKPIGGGDPIPLQKPELIVGRRASCDICLDFHNVSGKHCMFRLLNNVWHVRDLGSTNGTTINGAQLVSEHTLMPDDELGIAGHLYHLDYEPAGPESVLNKHQVIDEDLADARKKHSLMELAGLDTDENKPRHRARPTKAPERIERLSADEAEFDDVLPEHVKEAPNKVVEASDEDFLKLIEDDVKTSDEE
jgi:pSer/pThr/pTyr-binding forkhead associated (FHA) protein